MPDDPMKPNPIEENDDEGAPTAELPSSSVPEDPKEETAEAPSWKRTRSQPGRRRGLSKADRVKLWIILGGPIFIVVLAGASFFIKVDEDLTVMDSFLIRVGLKEDPRPPAVRPILNFLNEIKGAESTIEQVKREMAEVEKKLEGLDRTRAEDRKVLDKLYQESEQRTTRVSNVRGILETVKKEVMNYETGKGWRVDPSSQKVQEYIDRLEDLARETRELTEKIDAKIFPPKPPPPTGGERIIESGAAGHKKTEDEKKPKDERGEEKPPHEDDDGGR